MARRIVGYEGEGRSRRPIYVDEGPARARADAGFGLARFSEIRIPVELVDDPDRRAEERSQATEAQRAASRERRAPRLVHHPWRMPQPIPEPAPDQQPSPSPREPMEPSVTAATEPSSLVALVPVDTPCGTCVKADVCRIRDEIGGLSIPLPAQPDGISLTLSAKADCAHYLAGPVEPVQDVPGAAADPAAPFSFTEAEIPARRPRARVEPWPYRPGQRKVTDEQIRDALEASGGNMSAAGRELGISQTAVSLRVRRMNAAAPEASA